MSRPEIKLLFYFLRYVQPIWYFSLRPKGGIPHWIDYTKLTPHEQALISLDADYKSKDAMMRDAAYQAWQKGIILFKEEKKLDFSGRLPVEDNYRFLKKYYNRVWSVYVLIIRLITFNNPFLELYSFIHTLNVKRIDIHRSVNRWDEYKHFASELRSGRPLISIVIPTLNRYPYLKDVLRDIENQDYQNIEVIVIDQTEPFQAEFYKGWKFDLTVVNQNEKALWKARNEAIKMSKGEIILLYDDDSRVEPNWISEHLKCLDFFKADFSAGVSLSVVGAKIPASYSFLRWADQFDTGNVMIRKDVFRKIGLFDRQFEKQRMGDGEFGLRAYLAGCIGISNPYAKRVHLKVETGGLRQMGSWDGFRPTNWFAPRPIPSVLYYGRKYYGNKMAFYDLLIKVPASILPFRFKGKPAMMILSSALSALILPFVVYQVVKSWRTASGMLKMGPLVERLRDAD